MKFLLLFLLFCQLHTLSGQEFEGDSLGLSKINIEKAEELNGRGKYLSAIDAYHEALQVLPKNANDQRIKLLYDIGSSFQESRAVDSAKFYYQKAERFFPKIPDSSLQFLKLHSKGSLAYTQQKFDSALVYIFKAMDYVSLPEKYLDQRRVTIDVGLIFLQQKNYVKAREYLDESYNLSITHNDSIGIANSVLNLGVINVEFKNYEEAEEQFQMALRLFEKLENSKGILLAMSNLSKMYFFNGEVQKAVSIGLEIAPLIGQFEYSKDLKNLQSDYEETVKASQKEYFSDFSKIETAKELVRDNLHGKRDPSVSIEQSKAVIQYVEKGSELEESTQEKYVNPNISTYLKESLRLQDSLYQSNLERRLDEIEAKYQNEKKTRENLELKQENTEQSLILAKESKRKWIFIVSLITTLLVLGIFFIFYMRNIRQKKIIEDLQRELHHRMKNNLSFVDTFIEEAKREFMGSPTEHKFVELQNRIESINEVHKQLNYNNNIVNIDISEYIESLVENVKSAFNNNDISVKHKTRLKAHFKVDKSFPIGLIINEFLTNSFKHAFNNSGTGEISILLEEKGNNFNLTLSDNGKGLPKDLNIESLDSFGIDIMKLLTIQLQGKFFIDGKRGVTVVCTFPI